MKKNSDQDFPHKGPNTTFRAHIVTGPAVYHFGIIDFLQNWTFNKRIERAFKIYILRKDPDGLSVMHPHDYKVRFQGKVRQIIELNGKGGGIGMIEGFIAGCKTADNSKENDSSNGENIEMIRVQHHSAKDTSVTYNPMVQSEQ